MLANKSIFEPAFSKKALNNTFDNVSHVPWTEPRKSAKEDGKDIAKTIAERMKDKYISNSFKVAADSFEKTDEGSYQLYFRLAGYKKDDVDISLKSDKITISATSDDDFMGKRDFVKHFTVPEWVDVENISAKMNNGLLQVTLPKDKGGGGSQKIEIE